jgi:hypothetical protein
MAERSIAGVAGFFVSAGAGAGDGAAAFVSSLPQGWELALFPGFYQSAYIFPRFSDDRE